jgi:acetyltransferase
MHSMSLLSPSSIAVIGASLDEHKVGHLILRNLVTQGYEGHVFPVNPKGGEILGLKVFSTIGSIDAPVDLAIIVTPAETVLALSEECGKKKVKSLVVISAGFAESGKEGRVREEKLKLLAERYDMQLVGPNCLGLIRPSLRMNASFASRLPEAGTVALLSQSGALGDAFIDRAALLGLRLSLFVSMGNKAAMDECDYLELASKDPETKVIGLYLESIRDGQRFLRLASRIGQKKRIVLLKAGTSEKGRGAALSHTGVLAGSDAAVEAICAQAGVRRANSTEEFLDLLRTFSGQPALLSPRIVVITNAGGPGVLAADAAEREGLALPPLSSDSEAALSKLLPETSSVKNPIDVLGDALTERYEHALKIAAQDPGNDGALIILTPQVMTPAKEIATMLVTMKKRHPLFPFVACFMGEEGVHEAVDVLHAHGIPNFSSPETAVRMLAALQLPLRVPEKKTAVLDTKRAAKVAKLLRGAKAGLLDEERTQKLLQLYGLPLPRGKVATSPAEAARIAKGIGFPVTAKVSSKDVLHKVDVGGVCLNLETAEEVREAYADILRNVQEKAPQAHIAGVLIQQCLPPGNEFIVGALFDPSIGHLVMAGLGGVYTELFKDVSFRVAPILRDEAYPMLTYLRSWKLLLGMRGKRTLNIDAFAEVLSAVSFLVAEYPNISAIDLNPVLLTEKDLAILDAKIILAKNAA